jgi:hypothetical protein
MLATVGLSCEIWVGVQPVYKEPRSRSTLICKKKIYLQNKVFYEWAMPYRTSDLCRVKADLARSLRFAAIRFRHS